MHPRITIVAIKRPMAHGSPIVRSVDSMVLYCPLLLLLLLIAINYNRGSQFKQVEPHPTIRLSFSLYLRSLVFVAPFVLSTIEIKKESFPPLFSSFSSSPFVPGPLCPSLFYSYSSLTHHLIHPSLLFLFIDPSLSLHPLICYAPFFPSLTSTSSFPSSLIHLTPINPFHALVLITFTLVIIL